MEAHGNGDTCYNGGSIVPPASRKRSRTNHSDHDTTTRTDTSPFSSLDKDGHQGLDHPPNQSHSPQLAIDEAAARSRQLQHQQLPPSRQCQAPLPSSSPPTTEIIIKIVSAEYGPCEGNRLLTGELAYDESVTIPVTRDVAPFLRALLLAGQHQESAQEQHGPRPQQPEHPQFSSATATAGTTTGTDTSLDNMDVDTTTTTLGTNRIPNHDHHDSVRVVPPSGQGGAAGASSFIYLLNAAGSPSSRSMNTIFGDPCPGTSKRLHVHYIVTEASSDDDAKTRAAKTEVHHVSFAEHEMVVLRRRLTFFQDDVKLKQAVLRSTHKKQQQQQTPLALSSLNSTQNSIDQMKHNERLEDDSDVVDRSGIDDDEDEVTLRQARRLGRSQSIEEFTDATISLDVLKISPTTASAQRALSLPFNVASSLALVTPMSEEPPQVSSSCWRLRSAVSEIVLPIVLPFLKVQERVQCRLICRSWKYVVRDWGVATTIDSNDPLITNFTRPFLRGILSHSFSSLHSLFLSGLETLAREDLHPAIPNLRKLRSLDLTRCHNLDDTTMVLLSQHRTHQTLEVLYIKGLRQVTDVGIQAICRNCTKLEVLDISYVPITDEGGTAIQQLTLLKALYLRDNYLLTNRSIDVITEKCTRLAQLTLWGCTRLRHLSFGGDAPNNFMSASAEAGAKLVFLNLWGCHGLQDTAADSLVGMHSLNSLIVSECHCLTDQFVIKIANSAPQLRHLHLRYCKRITDTGINAITHSISNLYSLDLSFCSRITSTSIFNLLECRYDSLSELRLKNCTRLDILAGDDDYRMHDNSNNLSRRGQIGSGANGGTAGRLILNAIRANGSDNCLCLLDVRECGGSPPPVPPQQQPDFYPESDPFVQGMTELQFQQRVPGFFCRRARWNAGVQRRLVDQILHMGRRT